MGVRQVAATGNRYETLVALRDRLAAQIDSTDSSRDVAMLARQLADIMRELSGLAAPAKGSPLDELAKRRGARVADAASDARPARGAQRGR